LETSPGSEVAGSPGNGDGLGVLAPEDIRAKKFLCFLFSGTWWRLIFNYFFSPEPVSSLAVKSAAQFETFNVDGIAFLTLRYLMLKSSKLDFPNQIFQTNCPITEMQSIT